MPRTYGTSRRSIAHSRSAGVSIASSERVLNEMTPRLLSCRLMLGQPMADSFLAVF